MDLAAAGGGGENGDSAAKSTKLSTGEAAPAAAGEDRLSALPDDVLVLILLHLQTPAAARTSVLSRRWRRVWALLPELRFPAPPAPDRLRDALDAHEVPVRDLLVGADGATPESLATWLPAAARRVSGHLTLRSFGPGRGAQDDAAAAQRGAFELPCFEQATSISLVLRFDSLALPRAGVFARLTGLDISRVRFHAPGELGDAVSSPRCPCLQSLTVHDASGLDDLAIRSESLLQLKLDKLRRGLSQLIIATPALEKLTIVSCFRDDQIEPVASILAPQLATLDWRDIYDPRSIQLEMMAHLREGTFFYLAYGHDAFIRHNRSSLKLLQRFGAIETLNLALAHPPDAGNYRYLMEDMTVLPDTASLCLFLYTNGHAFGPCSFHVLRLCTSIRMLMLSLINHTGLEAQTVCPLGCICLQPGDWKNEELSLKHLEVVKIRRFFGSKHEIDFVRRLFNWGTNLKEMVVTFYDSISEIKAKESYEIFQSFSRPGLRVEFYIYRNFSRVLYAPEDLRTGLSL